ncbi:hypothetical protein GBF38_020885 [Nibea albiflora]|uniref:Uncharacterized protein n=1 Tax=Nibea albiflora TaxID=240163 RepID=A0ACB7FEI0_NIBAL|nr:hypothetical protein GBF38_020885 [Nibea albiflora]
MSATKIPTELPDPLNQSSICSSQTDTAAQSDNAVSIEGLETKITQTPPSNPSEPPDEPQASPQSPEISEQEPDACVDVTMDSVHLESKVETGSCQEHVMKKTKQKMPEMQRRLRPMSVQVTRKIHQQRPAAQNITSRLRAKEMLHEDTDESSPPGSKTFRSSFDWAQRRTVPPISVGHPSSSMPSFLKRKHNKGEQNFSVHQLLPGLRVVLRHSQQTVMADHRRVQHGSESQSDWEPSFSQEREEEQSSFRAQISKIEQFLNMEKLRLPKRRRTDD